MTIKGLKSLKPKKVDLGKFFDEPHSVTVRALPVTTRAKIQELASSGIRYATKQAKKSLDIESMEQAMPADVIMEVRALKLKDGFVEHDLTDESGKLIPWGPDLWAALDEADPAILGKVVDEITELSDTEDGEDPTSPAKSGTK